MLKKISLILISILTLGLIAFGSYQPYLPKGTLIKVQTRIPLTTEHLEEGSIVYFMVPADVWVLEKKAVAKGDIFRGYVSMLKLPTQGVNAAMSITISDLIHQDGTIEEFNGRIIFANSDVLGGNLTNPASYNKTIHPRRVYKNYFGGTMQYVPSGEYEFGRHIVINMRDSLFVQLDEDFYIY